MNYELAIIILLIKNKFNIKLGGILINFKKKRRRPKAAPFFYFILDYTL